MSIIPDLATLFRRGVRMEQHKEPAISADLELLTNKPGYSVIEGVFPVEDMDKIEPFEIIRRAKSARIVDERDGIPLFKKMRASLAKSALICVDCVDDEPYISSQMAPLIHLRDEFVGGLKLLQKAVGASGSRVEVYRNITDMDVHLPMLVSGVRVKRIGGVYPAEIRSNSSLVQDGNSFYLHVGACALVHLYRAVYQARLQESTFITVAGNCVAHPCNMEVNLGMPITDVLDRCGFVDTPTRIVVGGSMTGETVENTDDVTITVRSRAVLAMREDERQKRYNCIHCGRCTEVCPMRLNPTRIYHSIITGNEGELQKLDCEQCIQCMCCSFECPAKLDIAAIIAGYHLRKVRRLNEVNDTNEA